MIRLTGFLASGALTLLIVSACTDDRYVVGALCTAAGTCPGAGSGGTSTGGAGAGAGSGGGGSAGVDGGEVVPPVDGLDVELGGSGVERLPERLLGVDPTHLLIADDATQTRWEARVGDGFDVVGPAALRLAQPGPFADPGRVLDHAAAVAFSADSLWADTRDGALALEAVFRGQPGAVLLSQLDTDGGVQWSLDGDGRMTLQLQDGATSLLATSQPLVADAWHHCLALFDAQQGSLQIFCNGQAGVAVSVPDGFEVGPVTGEVTVGSADPARLRWAELGSWQAASWGPRGAWTDLARERFARLVGTYAAGAMEPLPFAEVRASGAYIDMSPSDEPELRLLHPVGEHWPRIVCRPSEDSQRNCGLLVEVASSRTVTHAQFALDNWNASELGVTATAAAGPSGEDTLFALTPSATNAEHSLDLDVPLANGPAVFALFARPGSFAVLRAEVVGVASATFDLNAATVLDSGGTLVEAIEPWGDGLVRLSYSFDITAGPGTLRVTLLSDDTTTTFPGDGSVAAYVGDPDLRFRSFSTPLPTFGTIQQADHLVYPAGNGNLPSTAGFSISADIWLPNAPLVADAAIFNANFATRYDQQINLFVSPDDGAPQFWGLQGATTHWQFSNPSAVNDGSVHRVTATVDQGEATLDVDGQRASESAGQYDTSVLDRIEIGTSTSSSGPFTGIISRIAILPPQP